MKVEKLKSRPKFIPIIIALETQEEVDKMFAIFTHTKICEAINERWWRKLLLYNSKNYIKYLNRINKILGRG